GAQVSTLGGDDRFLADYLETEHLAGLSSAQRQFALQTAVLAELPPEECDSLLTRSDSAQMLESLERAGVAVSLDHPRHRSRYPRVVRHLLSPEPERSEPEKPPSLHRAPAGGDDPRLYLLRGLRCHDGADQMLDDTTAACEALPPGHPWRPAAVLARSAALLLAGDTARAESELVLAVELATAAGATELAILGLCLRSLLAVSENEPSDAEAFAAEAASVSTLAPPAQSLVTLVLEVVGARNSARGGDLTEATAALERADQLLPQATPAVPWLAAYALLELARVRLTLADADGARTLLRRVSDIFRVRPRLGVLVQRQAELDRQTHTLSEPEGRWASSLTPAEQRLLPLLATHLSFREIGERLYVSRNTVKTQAIAVYRKFGVTSRSAAIE